MSGVEQKDRARITSYTQMCVNLTEVDGRPEQQDQMFNMRAADTRVTVRPAHVKGLNTPASPHQHHFNPS